MSNDFLVLNRGNEILLKNDDKSFELTTKTNDVTTKTQKSGSKKIVVFGNNTISESESTRRARIDAAIIGSIEAQTTPGTNRYGNCETVVNPDGECVSKKHLDNKGNVQYQEKHTYENGKRTKTVFEDKNGNTVLTEEYEPDTSPIAELGRQNGVNLPKKTTVKNSSGAVLYTVEKEGYYNENGEYKTKDVYKNSNGKIITKEAAMKIRAKYETQAMRNSRANSEEFMKECEKIQAEAKSEKEANAAGAILFNA